MKRIVLFSTLTEDNRPTILDQIFPQGSQGKVFSYMPSNGIENSETYIEEWRVIAQEHNVHFNVINNSLNDIEEQRKLLTSDILLISGGNTFGLLHNLLESGLDKSIKEFVSKSDFILAGFSAGALALTPSIKICNLPNFDENMVGLKDFNGLNIVDFEVYPHYNKDLDEITLEDYRKTTTNSVKEIADEDYISVNR